MALSLGELPKDFADALAEVDRAGLAHRRFQAGMGPFGQANAVQAALERMKSSKPVR